MAKNYKRCNYTNLWNVICCVSGVMGFIHLEHLHYMLRLVSGTWLQILEGGGKAVQDYYCIPFYNVHK
jgi:hypothetical protein